MEKVIWNTIRDDAERVLGREPALSGFLTEVILDQPNLYEALSCYLADKIENKYLTKKMLQNIFLEAMAESSGIKQSIGEDLQAIRERDPASLNYLNPFLNFKGYHALESYRVSHYLWENNRKDMALLLQSQIAFKYGVDIHPAAKIGRRIFIDHATSVVIGETAVIGDDVSLLHEVTLGGNGKEQGDRHPKIGNGVLIGAGAKVLGNITIGDGVKIGAGSVVLADVSPHTTVAGIPAKVVGKPAVASPSLEMDQSIEGYICMGISKGADK